MYQLEHLVYITCIVCASEVLTPEYMCGRTMLDVNDLRPAYDRTIWQGKHCNYVWPVWTKAV